MTDRRKGLDAIGRRARATVPYMIPEHGSEVDRLDVQHYAVREVIQGNYVAPIESPGRILDVGAGTGQWAFDLCLEFPSALVVGFDLLPSKAGAPANYRLVRGNLLQGLPFADHAFDFVHQRFFLGAVPLAAWPATVRELLRVTRSHGLVELAEPNGLRWERTGPATDRMLAVLAELGRTEGLEASDTIFRSLDDYLRQAGAVGVRRREVRLPIGEWGGRPGSLTGSNLRNLCSNLISLVEDRIGLPGGEYHALVDAAMRECEDHHSEVALAFAFGYRP